MMPKASNPSTTNMVFLDSERMCHEPTGRMYTRQVRGVFRQNCTTYRWGIPNFARRELSGNLLEDNLPSCSQFIWRRPLHLSRRGPPIRHECHFSAEE